MSNIDIEQIMSDRFQLIRVFTLIFKTEFEPHLSSRFLRGPVQKSILKKFNLPVTGPYMRLVNESIESLGYKKIYIDGWAYFRKSLE